MKILCIKDVIMQDGEIAFYKNKSYFTSFDPDKINFNIIDHVGLFAVNSEISLEHNMTRHFLKEHFSLDKHEDKTVIVE